jgi:CubicO group peptidase (beta-lactamase class C family)
VLVERATGAPLADLVRNRILDPCAMDDTTDTLTAGQAERFTAFYGSQPAADGAAVEIDAAEGGYWSTPPTFPDASGWWLSTVGDLWRFATMIRAGGTTAGGRRVLRAESVAAMTTNHVSDAQRAGAAPFLSEHVGWGYGMAVPLRTDLGFTAALGWAGGSGTLWQTDVGRDRTAILLTQRELGSPESNALFDAFLAAVDESLDA